MNNVHVGGDSMNTAVTSKEAILKVCRQITASDGLPGLNMRTVANRCHIALGTLYNYFPDKDSLLLSTVESIWKEIFHIDEVCYTDFSFPDYVALLFDRVRQGTGKYPDFLSAHSISIAGTRRGEASSIMDHYFDHMKQGLLEVLHADANVSPIPDRNGFCKIRSGSYASSSRAEGNRLLCLHRNTTAGPLLLNVYSLPDSCSEANHSPQSRCKEVLLSCRRFLKHYLILSTFSL